MVIIRSLVHGRIRGIRISLVDITAATGDSLGAVVMMIIPDIPVL